MSEVTKNAVELQRLVCELDAFQQALYPEESNHCVNLASLSDEKIRCLLVCDDDGKGIGCGAILLQQGHQAEIKRLYVAPSYRGNHLGEQIIAQLEKIARESGRFLLQLETGIHQQPAIRLYQQCGYARCAPFPPYTDDPLSVFMCKLLS
ncbi:GNAT family N-acetyltransferase [Acerihabitans sp. TG2]|uniref:GNAT family N-acetyltransferase n=1 Tax=Acerihabitans sp. TG2 TaxID=3096008 RepID=UPI002B22EE54|nr:GNAT family N-acetyltransferase [Acerihabitans sp. TG2]MEA9390149.1 GNAT family N-acetyltransferase [Acerihabitans sp. TG2]